MSVTYEVFLQIFNVSVVGNPHLGDWRVIIGTGQGLECSIVDLTFLLSDLIGHTVELLVLLLFVVHFRFD